MLIARFTARDPKLSSAALDLNGSEEGKRLLTETRCEKANSLIWPTLRLDLREQVGADRGQDRGEATEDHELDRAAEHETAAERAAQAVDAVAERVEPHREPNRRSQVGHRKQGA
jgi:hypothetical protein